MSQILSPKQIINLKHQKLEKNEIISNLGWGDYKDVLYSFLGIFTLGIYIFEKENVNKCKYSIGEDYIIRIDGTRQWLYSRRYISKHFDEFSDLANTKEISDFAKVYTSIGNIIPIWPGGNEFKGKAHCYDIPDIFFSEPIHAETEKMYVLHVLKISIEDVALARFMTGSPYVKDIKDVFEYNIEEYKKFVRHIINEIEVRTREIERVSQG